jgi:hypothetical protein
MKPSDGRKLDSALTISTGTGTGAVFRAAVFSAFREIARGPFVSDLNLFVVI